MGLYSTTVASKEVGYTLREDHDVDSGSNMSVQLECAWADRYNLLNEILGNEYTWPHGAFTNVVAKKAQIIPQRTQYTEHGSGGGIVYQTALVTIQYLAPNNNIDETAGGDLYSETLEPVVEFIKQNPDRFAWASGTGPPVSKEEAPGKQVYMMNIVRTLYNLASVPAAVFTCIGGVNDTAYVSATLGFSFGVETLLYQPPTLSRTVKIDGTKLWSLTMKFAYKPNGWNQFWRAGVNPAQWDEFYDIAAGAIYKNYHQVDMTSLLF